MRLRKRFLLVYGSILVLFEILAIFLTGYFFQERTLRIIRLDHQRSIYFLEKMIAGFLESVEHDVLFLTGHPYVQYRDDSGFTSFIGIEEASFQYDYSPEELRIIEIFRTYKANHPYVNSVYMGRENGSFVRSHERNRNTPYDPRIRPWYTLGRNNPDRVLRTDIYPSVTTDDLNIGTVKALRQEGGVYGVVGIDVTLTNLHDFIEGTEFSDNYYSEWFILDGKGNVILSNQQAFLNNNFSNLFPAIDQRIASGQVDDIYACPSEESSFFFTFSDSLGWYLGGVVSDREIRRMTRANTYQSVLWEGIVIAILGGLFLYVSDAYIVRRIQKLHDDVNLLSTELSGKPQLPLQKDEISLLGTSFLHMFHDLQKANRILRVNQAGAIYCLGNLADTRDPETGQHILRTQHYVRLIAEKLRMREKHRTILTRDTVEKLFLVAPLHDIGKIGIPDKILLKPGKLTEEEFEIMKDHTTLGYKALRSAVQNRQDNALFTLAAELALTHHERWDGSGYPHRLSGAEIPLCGRIMALADIYDALSTSRVYKQAFAEEKTRRIIAAERGRHLDPELVDIFLENEREFHRICGKYTD